MKTILPFMICSLFLYGCGQKTAVQVVKPERGAIQESFQEPAKTRLAETWPIHMPVDGRLARITLKPGDRVKKGQALAEIDLIPFEEAVREAQAVVRELEARIVVNQDHRLENTAAAEAEAAVKAAAEALNAADAQIDAERARLNRTAKALKRKESLVKASMLAEDQFDDVKLDAETALISLRKEQFNRAALKALIVAVNLGPRAIQQYISRKDLEKITLDHKLTQAKSRLKRAERQLVLARILSPIDGMVLLRRQLGDRTVMAGEELLVLGDLNFLEVEADLLTQDAMKLKIGSEVILKPSAGIQEILGEVSKIEPQGFTKRSSLGVEQQRVKVIVKLLGSKKGLGVGYRVQARFVTGKKENGLKVPRFSVMQAKDRSYYLFAVQNHRLEKRIVTLGVKSDMEFEVISGVTDQDWVVSRPDGTMAPGTKVKIENND